MRSNMRRRLWVPALVVSSAASVLFAGTSARPEGPPHYINSVLDGAPVIVVNPVDGKTYSAWKYRAGLEFDIAVSVRDPLGSWSLPIFFGQFDGVDQGRPALVVDAGGHVYLAFASADSGRVFVAAHAAGTSWWTMPVPVSPEGVRAADPAMAVVGDRLVVGFRTGRRVGLVEIPLLGSGTLPLGIHDGPDPLGDRQGQEDDDRQGGESGSAPISPGR